jgi:hypothetical protein
LCSSSLYGDQRGAPPFEPHQAKRKPRQYQLARNKFSWWDNFAGLSRYFAPIAARVGKRFMQEASLESGFPAKMFLIGKNIYPY